MQWRTRIISTLILILSGTGGGPVCSSLAQQLALVGAQQRFQLVSRSPIVVHGKLVGDVFDIASHPTQPLFFVVDRQPPGVFVLTANGRFLRSYGRQGEGPGEFLGPPSVTVWGDTLLVLDPTRNRLEAYRVTTGQLLTLSMLPQSLPGFQHWILHSNHLVLYLSGRRHSALVEVYDFSRRRYTHTLSISKLTPEHDLLLSYIGSGGLALLGDSLVLATPADRLTLYFLNLRTGQQGIWLTLQDPDFRIQPAPDLEKLLRQGRWRAYQKQWVGYLTSNSRTCGLFVLDNGLLAVQLEYGPDQQSRWLRLIVIDLATRQEIDRITLPVTVRQQYGLMESIFRTAQGPCLYIERFLEEQDRWALWPWCLEPSSSP